jgi:hypothetical protein
MIPLAPNLDDTDFDALVTLARGMLPSLTRAWDDYNYHDPGITLVELLAFIADTQVYALGHNRLDERLAMAALLDARPRGAVPATGTLYPRDPVAAAYEVQPGARITPWQAPAPRLEALYWITVLPIRLVRVVSELAGQSIDQTKANAQARASFTPFGEPPAPGAALRLTFEGAIPDDPVSLSLGVEIDGDTGHGAVSLGQIDVFADDSRAMQRSGAMVFDLPAMAGRAGQPQYEFVLRPRAPTALMPRLVRIAPNALAVAQRATLSRDGDRGNGRAGQLVEIVPPSLFDADEAAAGWTWRLTGPAAATVKVSEGQTMVGWERGDLAHAEPGARVYDLAEQPDGSRIQIRFGNGVNGRRPPLDATIEVGLQLSGGAGGNVQGGLDWLLAGQRTHWANPESIAGGADAQDIDATLAGLRDVLRNERTLTTSGRILDRVRALPSDYGVARAEMEEGWEPGRRKPAHPATRTLIVARRGEATETPPWRAAILRSLRPHLPIGERLVVASPVYRRLRVGVQAVAVVGQQPAAVAEAIRQELADRLTPDGARGSAWPLGRDVDAVTVGGWIRRVDGVSAIRALDLLDEQGAPLPDGVLAVGRGELPLLVAVASDVAVETGRRP